MDEENQLPPSSGHLPVVDVESSEETGSLREAHLGLSRDLPKDPSSSFRVQDNSESKEEAEADMTLAGRSSHVPFQKQTSARHLRFSFVTEKHRIRQESTANMFGGFGEMNQTVKLYQKIGACVKDGKYETLDNLYYMGSSSESKFMEETEIKMEAREQSVRQMTGMALFLFTCYFIISVPVLIHLGGVDFQEALLYCVYTMTSTGFGSVKVPLESSAFLVFLIFVMFFGVACVMLVAATLYLYISLQASKMKRNLDKARAQRALDADTAVAKSAWKRHHHQPVKIIGALRSCVSAFDDRVRKNEGIRVAVIGGYLLFILVGGAIAMMFFEDWTLVEALYFASYCMTTMGYGDVAPKTSEGIWFVIFWLPLNVTFISFYMGNLARYYMLFGSAYTRRVYKREIELMARSRQLADEVWDLVGVDNSRNTSAEDTAIHSMQAVVDLVLENFLHKGDDTCSGTLRKLLNLESPWTATGLFHRNQVRKPSFALQVLMQERLITILAEEVTAMFADFFEKDSTFVVAVEPLQAIAEKWKIPAGAREAFALVAFEATAYVGEERMVMAGTNAFLKLTPFECHTLFSPLLSAFEDAGTMEGWLATTEEIASSYSNVKAFDLTKTEGKLALCDNEKDILTLAWYKKEYDRSMEAMQAMNLSRYKSNRTLAWVILTSFLAYQSLATIYIILRADVTVGQGLLYTVYTMTSAGFGSVKVPTETSFLLVAILNMFMSVSLFAIVIAQTLIYFQAVIVRREHSSDKVSMARNGQVALTSLISDSNQESKRVRDVMRSELMIALQGIPGSSQKENRFTKKQIVLDFLLATERGRVICVACTLLTLWFTGAIATMITEDWNIFQGLYFATYALLTVGHGDLVPQSEAGTWFCVVWLPLNIIFVSLYLGSVAHLFVILSNKRTSRIEERLRQLAKLAKQEKQTKGSGSIPTEPTSHAGTDSIRIDKTQRRLHIKQNSKMRMFSSDGAELVHARDLLKKLDQWQPTRDPSDPQRTISEGSMTFTAAEGELSDDNFGALSSKYHALLESAVNDEGFALRLAVLDRVARIISTQLNDFDSGLEVDSSILRVSVDSLNDWISDWKIPQRARHVYREMTFECLLFVGEKKHFEAGVGAFFNLRIVEFIELFSPFVFALKHKEALEEWLRCTDDLASTRLPLGFDSQCHMEVHAVSPPRSDRYFVKNKIENYFPVNPGNAIREQLKNK